jgi:hypothetical protein
VSLPWSKAAHDSELFQISSFGTQGLPNRSLAKRLSYCISPPFHSDRLTHSAQNTNSFPLLLSLDSLPSLGPDHSSNVVRVSFLTSPVTWISPSPEVVNLLLPLTRQKSCTSPVVRSFELLFHFWIKIELFLSFYLVSVSRLGTPQGARTLSNSSLYPLADSRCSINMH